MGSLKDQMDVIVKEIAAYAKPSLTGEPSYLTQSADGRVFAVVDILSVGNRHQADTGLVVRVADEYIIIEHDMNNKPLVDALTQVGIPRDKIILAYDGEPVPATAA